MPGHVNPYILQRKSWSIKNILSNYFKAINLSENIAREYRSGKPVPYERMRQLSDILFTCKEELHLIYERLANPRKNEFDSSGKYLPNTIELDFIYNVGLLFHKAMVIRELKYMLEYYETDADDDYYSVKVSLDDYIDRLVNLFNKGIKLVEPLLLNFIEDVVVMSYFVENERYVRSVLGEEAISLFKRIKEAHASNGLYVKIASYFLASGWEDRAKKVLFRALKSYPNDHQIREMLIQCS